MERGSSGSAAVAERTVAEVLAACETIAPLSLAADRHKGGWCAGRREWPANRVLLAIDLTDAVAREALTKRADVLLVYHPPIFKGIRSITPQADCPTTLLPDLLAARTSIIAWH